MNRAPGHLDPCDGIGADGKPCPGRFRIYKGLDGENFRTCYLACSVCKRKPLRKKISVPNDDVLRRKRKRLT